MKQIFKIVAVAAMAIVALASCGGDKDNVVLVPGLNLSDISATNYPTYEDSWTIATTSATARDFQGLIAALKQISFDTPNRKISLDFPNLVAMPEGAFQLDASESKASLNSLVSVSSNRAIEVGAFAFYAAESIESLSFPAATKVLDYAFTGCTSLDEVNIGNAQKIGKGAFGSCSSLVKIALPNVYELGESAFSVCSALESVDIPNLTVLGSQVFTKCTALESIKLPAVTQLKNDAMINCTNLQSASFPCAINIGTAFTNCHSLTEVTLASAPGAIIKSFSNPFFGVDTTQITLTLGSSNWKSVFNGIYYIYDKNNKLEFKSIILK